MGHVRGLSFQLFSTNAAFITLKSHIPASELSEVMRCRWPNSQPGDLQVVW